MYCWDPASSLPLTSLSPPLFCVLVDAYIHVRKVGEEQRRTHDLGPSSVDDAFGTSHCLWLREAVPLPVFRHLEKGWCVGFWSVDRNFQKDICSVVLVVN